MPLPPRPALGDLGCDAGGDGGKVGLNRSHGQPQRHWPWPCETPQQQHARARARLHLEKQGCLLHAEGAGLLLQVLELGHLRSNRTRRELSARVSQTWLHAYALERGIPNSSREPRTLALKSAGFHSFLADVAHAGGGPISSAPVRATASSSVTPTRSEGPPAAPALALPPPPPSAPAAEPEGFGSLHGVGRAGDVEGGRW